VAVTVCRHAVTHPVSVTVKVSVNNEGDIAVCNRHVLHRRGSVAGC
jgi:hypothetical protein